MVGGLDAWREGLCQTLADGAGDGDRAGPPGGDQADRGAHGLPPAFTRLRVAPAGPLRATRAPVLR